MWHILVIAARTRAQRGERAGQVPYGPRCVENARIGRGRKRILSLGVLAATYKVPCMDIATVIGLIAGVSLVSITIMMGGNVAIFLVYKTGPMPYYFCHCRRSSAAEPGGGEVIRESEASPEQLPINIVGTRKRSER